MYIQSITSEIAKQYAIPESCLEGLSNALQRIISDGRSALAAGKTVAEHVRQELETCAGCVSEKLNEVVVINGDNWEKLAHQSACVKSVDIALLERNGDEVFVLPVDGKLGMSCNYQGDRGGMSVRSSELVAKMNGLRALLPASLLLCGDMMVLVPRNGQEWAWYLVRRWNLDGSHDGRFFSCCISDFVALVGLASNERPAECSTTMNAYRRNRLVAEFEHNGPMSRVQLPMAGFCIGCRKCRDVCPKSAIAIIPNEQGVRYPHVDMLSCKPSCRHCESVCPVLQQLKK